MAIIDPIIFPDFIANDEKRKVIITILKNTMVAENFTRLAELKQDEEIKIKNFLDKINKDIKSGNYDNITKTGNKYADTVYDKLSSISKTEPIAKIVLPLPNTFTDNHQHSWNVSTGIASEVSKAFLEGSMASKFKQGMAIAVDSANIRKPLADPGFFQSYDGTQPRTFSFTFELVPNSPEEAKKIIKIIKMFRKYSLPSTLVNHAILLSPHYFSIKFGNRTLDSAVNARNVVLTNIAVDYGADGAMQFLPDGTPKQMTLNLVFAERQMTVENTYII